MKRILFAVMLSLLIIKLNAQNIGIGTKTPTEKLNVDSGNIRIGKGSWLSSTDAKFLKFGDANYITIGEEEGDDQLTIRARELLIRPHAGNMVIPVSIQGTNNFSHFNYGVNEHTYIRAGLNNGNVILNNISGGKVGIGMGNPSRSILEQFGAIGTTAAIFGGDGAGISLQQNWPAIGFNEYYNGSSHKSIGMGFSAQLGLDQTNGSLYLASWPFAPSDNVNLGSYSQRFYVSRAGKIGIGTAEPLGDFEINENSNDATNFNYRGIRISKDGNAWNITKYTSDFLNFFFNGDLRAGISNSTGNWASLSDKNFKKNISPLSNNNLLDKILQLEPVTYQMKTQDADGYYQFGFIAQEVEKIFPQLVVNNEDRKMLDYTAIIPLAVQAIKEQQQQLQEMKKEIADLKQLIQEKIK